MTKRSSKNETLFMPEAPDAIVLCGGAGLRLRSIIGDAPKPMANVGGRPFLELLLRQLQRHGFRRVILAAGYRMDVIHSHFGEDAFGVQLLYSAESLPLGTGGAVRQAANLVVSESVLIMNGDSYTDVDLYRVLGDHRASGAHASIVVVPADGRNDCGAIRVDERHRVVRFEEKYGSADALYYNAGIYAVCRPLLYEIPSGIAVSIEKQLFPRWLEQGHDIRALPGPGRCVDIGTPERYRAAQELLAHVASEERSCGHGPFFTVLM
jgi:NDP-sugar pyrophosphorylase family protein